MRLSPYSFPQLWLNVGTLVCMAITYIDAASVDFQAPAVRDSYAGGGTRASGRTIRHSKGLTSGQLSQKAPVLADGSIVMEPNTDRRSRDGNLTTPQEATVVEKSSRGRAVDEDRRGASDQRSERRATLLTILSRAKNITNVGGQGRFATVYTNPTADLPTFVCEEGQVACPTPNKKNVVQCIAIETLCDKKFDCYGSEDEDPIMCTFYRQVYADLNTKIKKINSQLLELNRYVDQHRHDSEGHVIRPT